MPNGSEYFTADKATRQEAFSFPNQSTIDAVTAGDQSAQLHPVPAALDQSQKVGNPLMEPAQTLPTPPLSTPGASIFPSDKVYPGQSEVNR